MSATVALSPDFSVAGRVALVTGSSRGIGYALARSLATAGARVVVHGRHRAGAVAAAAAIAAEAGTEVAAAAFEVGDEAQVVPALADLAERVGSVEILVNNAGIQRRAPLLDFTAADWDDLVATNLTGAFLVAREAGRQMVARGRGKIINIGSVQSLLGRPGIAAYAATKGGVAMLTRGLCAELAPHNIQVNCIAPGYFATELTAPLVADAEFSAWVERRTPAGRWGELEDLRGALHFLASPASDFVNGQILYVDGGMTAVV